MMVRGYECEGGGGKCCLSLICLVHGLDETRGKEGGGQGYRLRGRRYLEER